jgi:hypothetical protein
MAGEMTELTRWSQSGSGSGSPGKRRPGNLEFRVEGSSMFFPGWY